MLRSEIRMTDFGRALPSEVADLRPAILVSNDLANTTAARFGRGVVTVVPVTSNVARLYPFQVALPAAETGLRVDSKAQAEQVRALPVARVGRLLGAVPGRLMAELDDALRLHLTL